MKPFTECRIFNYLSLASSPKQTVSDEEFSSSYTEYEQYLYDLAIESVSVSERLRHLLHSKVELISLKKLFTRTGHFHTAVAEFYLDKCLLLVEAEIELVNFGVQYPRNHHDTFLVSFIAPLERFAGQPDGTDLLAGLQRADYGRKRQTPLFRRYRFRF